MTRENYVNFKCECPDVNIGTPPCPLICELSVAAAAYDSRAEEL